MTNPLETARKNLHKRYQLLTQDLVRVVSMLTLHEHTGFKTIQPAIDILQELIAGLTDSEKDLEHGLGLLRSTRDELCAVPKYHDDVELVGTKQVEFNITGVPDLPELNYELVSRILDGRLEYALIHIDDWLVEQ